MLQLLGAPPHPSAASGTRAIRQSSPGHRSHPIEATAQSDRAEKESTSARQGFKCLVMGLTVGYSDFESLMVVSLFECHRVLVPDEVVAPWAELLMSSALKDSYVEPKKLRFRRQILIAFSHLWLLHKPKRDHHLYLSVEVHR